MARWSYYRRRPIFGFNEIPKDSTENCNAYCDAMYGKLVRKHLYYQACIGVCASKQKELLASHAIANKYSIY